MGYPLITAIVKSELKGMTNDLHAGKNFNMDVRAQWKKVSNPGNGFAPPGRKFEFSVQPRLTTGEFQLGENDSDRLVGDGTSTTGANRARTTNPASQSAPGALPTSGVRTGFRMADEEFQGLDRVTHEIEFSRGLRMGVTMSQYDRAFNDTTKDYEVDGRVNMANVLDKRLFGVMQRGASVFVPGYVQKPDASGANDPKNTEGGINPYKIRIAAAKLDSFGNFDKEMRPFLFMSPMERAILDETAMEHQIDRSRIGQVLMKQYNYDISNLHIATSNNLVQHTCGLYGNTADGTGGTNGVGADWEVDTVVAGNVDATDNSQSGGLSDTGFRNRPHTDAMDKFQVLLRAKLPAGVGRATSVGLPFQPGDVIQFSDSRASGDIAAADSADGADRATTDSNRQGGLPTTASRVVRDVNPASRFETPFAKDFTVLACTPTSASGTGAGTAIAAAGTAKCTVTLSPAGVHEGAWRCMSRKLETGDKVSVVSGAPGATYSEIVGWQADGLGLIYKDPLSVLTGGRGGTLPSLETYSEALPDFNGLVVAAVAWADGQNYNQRFRKDILYAARSIQGWWKCVRIRGQRLS